MYGKAHDLETALQLADRLPKQYGFDMQANARHALLVACCTAVRLEQAQTQFDNMEQDSKAFSTLIFGCLKHHAVPLALSKLKLALDQNVRLEQELVQNCVF